MKNLTAVEVYENKSLTVIGDRAFKDCKKLKTIDLENFKNLESIGLPHSETTVGEVFENTGLREITNDNAYYRVYIRKEAGKSPKVA